MIHPEKRRTNRQILEKAMEIDERTEPSPSRKAEIEEQLSIATKIELHRCWCIFCMKEFCSCLRTANICPECMVQQDEASKNLLKDDDYDPMP